MARIHFAEFGETPFQRLLGHNQDILKSWTKLEEVFLQSQKLSPELKEQVRRTLAFGNGCQYCMSKGKPDEVQPDGKQALAVAFADMVMKDHLMIDESHFGVLREEFSEKGIAELCAYICFITASQMFGAIMNLAPDA